MIRRIEEKDIEAVVRLELDTINTTLGKEMLFKDLANELSYNFVYELDGKIIAYISTIYDGYNLEILNYCVAINHQNKGIGRKLLNFVLSYFYSKNVITAILEVRKSNSKAIHIYELFGFKIISVRKSYYQNGEDAYVMQKSFIPFLDIEKAYKDCFYKYDDHNLTIIHSNINSLKLPKFENFKVVKLDYSNKADRELLASKYKNELNLDKENRITTLICYNNGNEIIGCLNLLVLENYAKIDLFILNKCYINLLQVAINYLKEKNCSDVILATNDIEIYKKMGFNLIYSY